MNFRLFGIGRLVFLGTLGCSLLSPPELSAKNIAVLLSRDLPPYNQALKGFRSHSKVEITVFNMGGSRVEGYRLSREINSGGFEMVVAFGAKAATVAKEEVKKLPIAYCMVVDPYGQKLVGHPNIAGIPFALPIKTQLASLKEVVPNARRIGVIYSPRNSKSFIEKLGPAARRLGLEIVGIKAESRRDVPAAIRKLQETNVDLFWMIPDPVLLSKTIIKELLVFTLANRIPFMAPVETIVRKGALFSVSADYMEQGKQLSGLTARILGGESPAAIGLVDPEGVRIGLNLKTADSIHISIPKPLLKKAHILIQNGPAR